MKCSVSTKRSWLWNSELDLNTRTTTLHLFVYSVRGLERSELGELMADQGAYGNDFYERTVIRTKHSD